MRSGTTENVSLKFYGMAFGIGSLTKAGVGVAGEGLAARFTSTAFRGTSAERSMVDIVKSHITQFGDDAGNTGMIQRLENAMANGDRVTGADRNFYAHELKEATLMKSGLPYETAHPNALQ